MRKLNYPDQAALRDAFDYDPDTGHLIRKHSTKGYNAGRRVTRLNDAGYIVTTFNGVGYRVHHLVWIWHHGEAVAEIDHINRVKNDNRIENLRACLHIPNCGNSSPRVYKYKGVTFCKQTQKWKAQIGMNYRNYSLGRFCTIEEAALAYNEAAKSHFGEFATLNEVVR
jgi:hypothetical protein